MIETLHIFDFDGCLVDSSHRYKLGDNGKIDLQHWIANECRTLDDKVLPLMDYFKALTESEKDYPLIATARIWCNLSKIFTSDLGLSPTVIARRDRTDTRGGAALKILGVKRLLNLKQFKNVKHIHVYEDNKSYLQDICAAFENTIPHFIPSNQGH